MKSNQMRRANAVAGYLLVAIGLGLAYFGVSALPHGQVAGGTVIWILFFGGAVIMAATGIYLVRGRRTNPD